MGAGVVVVVGPSKSEFSGRLTVCAVLIVGDKGAVTGSNASGLKLLPRSLGLGDDDEVLGVGVVSTSDRFCPAAKGLMMLTTS